MLSCINFDHLPNAKPLRLALVEIYLDSSCSIILDVLQSVPRWRVHLREVDSLPSAFLKHSAHARHNSSRVLPIKGHEYRAEGKGVGGQGGTRRSSVSPRVRVAPVTHSLGHAYSSGLSSLGLLKFSSQWTSPDPRGGDITRRRLSSMNIENRENGTGCLTRVWIVFVTVLGALFVRSCI